MTKNCQIFYSKFIPAWSFLCPSKNHTKLHDSELSDMMNLNKIDAFIIWYYKGFWVRLVRKYPVLWTRVAVCRSVNSWSAIISYQPDSSGRNGFGEQYTALLRLDKHNSFSIYRNYFCSLKARGCNLCKPPSFPSRTLYSNNMERVTRL